MFSYFLPCFTSFYRLLPFVGFMNTSMPHHLPLFSIRVRNNRKVFAAFIDSGAEVNVVSSALLSQMTCHRFLPPASFKLAFIEEGRVVNVQQWVEIPFLLPSGVPIWTPCAVLESPHRYLNFGVPFLSNVGGVFDLPKR